ncbi:uncharacterized protein EI97DRAFT_481060 [Westerdykella ornata]|uniref:Uncharacterized protein n=1 Tax=Westerdykella ornata TaxID=318751 RepID=A0A6A6JA13_WESOR|nr:uncharacterized protein EI97DRAFT_481060 [Westerdykella ornata]KAF2273175.1 hypothetical protein EI97DRAFT_481060 [Westerdykella ornata]
MPSLCREYPKFQFRTWLGQAQIRPRTQQSVCVCYSCFFPQARVGCGYTLGRSRLILRLAIALSSRNRSYFVFVLARRDDRAGDAGSRSRVLRLRQRLRINRRAREVLRGGKRSHRLRTWLERRGRGRCCCSVYVTRTWNDAEEFVEGTVASKHAHAVPAVGEAWSLLARMETSVAVNSSHAVAACCALFEGVCSLLLGLTSGSLGVTAAAVARGSWRSRSAGGFFRPGAGTLSRCSLAAGGTRDGDSDFILVLRIPALWSYSGCCS